MTQNPVVEAVADQFRRSLLMMENAVRAYPAQEWRRGDLAYLRPAGLAYHLVDTLDFYTCDTPPEAYRGKPLCPDWETAADEELPTQAQVLDYLAEMKARLAAWLETTDLLAPDTARPWTGPNTLGRALYLLRHNQHHISELYIELTRRGLSCPEWE